MQTHDPPHGSDLCYSTKQNPVDPRNNGEILQPASMGGNPPLACTRWSWSLYPNAPCPPIKRPVVDLSATSTAQQAFPPLVIPLGCLYAPFYHKQDTVSSPGMLSGGHRCVTCDANLHMYCHTDMDTMSWVCTMCRTRNSINPVLKDGLPEVVTPTYVIAAPIPNEVNAEVIFLFVIDLCLPVDELDALKSQVQRVMQTLPTHAFVGLITFGEMVHVWELSKSLSSTNPYNRCYSLQGNRVYTEQEVRRYLDLSPATQSCENPTGAATLRNPSMQVNRFLIPLEDAEFSLAALVDELQSNETYPALVDGTTHHRPLRCTGSALQIASHLLAIHRSATQNASTKQGFPNPRMQPGAFEPDSTNDRVVLGRILLFVGGPCTKGPGAVVPTERTHVMRSQRDLLDGSTHDMMKKAVEFYATIAQRLIQHSIAADILIGSLDQVGLLEMSSCAHGTGGMMLDTPSFSSECFRESIGRAFFQRRVYYSVTFEVFTSRETLLSGVLGPVHNCMKETPSVSPYVRIGHGGSAEYSMSVADESTTLALYFDTSVGLFEEATHRYVQLRATYYEIFSSKIESNPTVQTTCRRLCHVTTVALPIARTMAPQYYIQCGAFDQEVAAVLTARQAVHLLSPALTVSGTAMDSYDKATNSKSKDKGGKHLEETFLWVALTTLCSPRVDMVRRWLDRSLVQLLQLFSSYTPNVPESVRPPSGFSLYPSFIYHLRRSEFFQILNLSPDERVYKVQYLNREGCEDCLAMVQPTLQAYSCEHPEAVPVPLDASSVNPEQVLLLDSFFEVVVHIGTTMAQWRALGYDKNPEYPNFALSLAKPIADAKAILSSRFPYPTYRETDQNGSQARFLLRYLNPSTQSISQGVDGEIIHTDDAAMSTFFASLKVAIARADPSKK